MALSKRGKLTLKVVLVVLAVAAVVGVATYFIVSSLASYKKVTLQYNDGRTVVHSVREDGKFGIPADNTREGYAFENWYVDQGCTVPFNFDSAVSDDITIYAKWTPVNTINFYLNDGTDGVFKTFTNQDYEKPFAVPSEEPTREKYNFLGWSPTPDVGTSRILYKYGTTNRAFEIPLNGISLYAQWSRDEVTIKYDFGIGSLNGKKSEVVVLDRNTEHDIKDLSPSCKGHTFIGWSPDMEYVEGESLLYQSADLPTEDGSNPVNPKLIATQSTVLYAVYRQHTITLRFFSNTFDTVTGVVPDLIVPYNQPTLIPNIVYERDGYGLYAWATKPNYEIGVDTSLVYVPGEDWFTFGDSYTDTEVVELYAIWVVREISLTFDFGGGVGTLNGIPYTGKEYTLTAQYNTEFTVPSFSVKYNIDDAFFAGFAAVLPPDPTTGRPQRSEIFYAGDTIWLKGDMVLVGADGTLTVVIEAFYSNSVTYEVNFELNGGVTSGGVNRLPAVYVVYPPTDGNTTLITLQELTKKGYTFVGWTTVNGKEGTKIEDADEFLDGVQYNVNRNITLYAYFVPYHYNIEYHGNGETNGFTVDKGTYYYDEAIPLSRCGFEKEGYDFVGWATTPTGEAKYTQDGTFEYLLREGDNPEFILGLYPAGTTLHFYAVWEIKTYTVTFSEGEGYTLSAEPGYSSTVRYNEDFVFKFQFVTGYDKAGANIYVNGVLVTLSDWKYTIKNVKSNINITVDGVKINTFNVSLPESDKFIAEAYGSSVGVTEIGYGHSYQFRIRLYEPYTQSTIVVKTEGTDGTIKTLEGENGIYIIDNIIFDQTVTVEGIEKNTYTITLVSGTGYTLEAFEGASLSVKHGDSFTFKFILDERYNLSPFVLHVNGADVVSYEQVTGEALSYLGFLEDIRNDKTITVSGVTINTYTVNLAVGIGYTMVPVGGSSSPCDHGTSFTFKFTLEAAYSESPFEIKVNGEKVTLDANNQYTITDITKNITVTVLGIQKNRYDITMPTFDKQVGYTLTAEGSTNVEYGSNLTIAFALKTEYTKSNYTITVNGEAITLDADGKYEIQNIIEHKAIEVSGVTMNTYTVSYLPSIDWYGYTFDFWAGNPRPIYYGDDFVFSFAVSVGFDDRTVQVYVIEYAEDGSEIKRTDVYADIKAGSGQYTIENITTDIELFVDGIQVIEWNINVPSSSEQKGYTIKNIDGYTNKRPSGRDFKFIIELDEAYSYSTPVVFVNNIQIVPIDEECSVDGETKTRQVYTISNIIEDQYVVVQDVKINAYQVLIPTGAGYTVTPVDSYDPTRVEHGGSFRFRVVLDEAYQASASQLKVKVNGEIVSSVGGVYIINNVVSNQGIEISGIGINKYNISFPEETFIETYFEIFSSTQALEVEWGGSFTFTVKLKPKYSQSDIIVTANGAEVPHAGTTYVITSVKAHQVIAVTTPTINQYQIALPSGQGYVAGYSTGTEALVEHEKEAQFYYYLLPNYSDSADKIIIRINGTVVDPKSGSVPDLNLTIAPYQVEVDVDGTGTLQTCKGYLFTVNPVEKRYQMTIAGVANNVYLVDFQAGEGFTYTDDRVNELTYYEAAQDNVPNAGSDTIKFKVNLETKYNKSEIKVISVNEKTAEERELELVDGFYQLIDIRANYAIRVEGVEINTYAIKLPETQTGYRIVQRASSTNPVEYGQAYGFTIELDAAYSKSPVKVYSIDEADERKEIVVASGIYIIRNVTQAYEVVVEGVTMNTYQIKLPTLGEQKGYTIKASDGYETTVLYDQAFQFEFALLYGYTDSNFTISINGFGVGKNDLTGGKTYTIGNITDDQVITVKNVQLNTYVMEIPTGEGYTISVYNGINNIVTHGYDFNFILTLGEAYKESEKNVKIYYAPTDETRPRELITKADGYYTIEDVVEPLTITIEGVAISVFDITFPEGGVGYKIAAFNDQEMQVEYNNDFVFTVVLEEAYSDSPVMVKANGVFLSPQTAGSTIYKISGIKAHQTITVENVVVNTYKINLITGTGYNFAPITEGFVVEFGEPYEFNVTLLEGYTKSNYTVRYRTTGSDDDTTLELTGSKYILPEIKSNKDIYVINVQLNTYQVTYPQVLEQGFTITPVANQSTTVVHGTEFKFTIALDEKHDRSNFTITANDIEISASAGTYILSNIKDDQVIKVLNITINTYTITFPTRQVGYKVEAVSGFSSPVLHGGNFQFSVTLEEAYSDSSEVMIIRVNDSAVGLTGGKCQISGITDDQVITVSGVTKNIYDVVLTEGEGYTLIPQAGSESPVEWGESFSFKFILKEEYDQSNYDVLINDVSIKSQLVSGGYRIDNIKSKQTITVTGVEKNIYTITFPETTEGYELKGFTTANKKILHGLDFSFQISLLPPYSESQISVKANGISLFEAGGKFTIKNVTQHQNVEITGVTKNLYDIVLRTGEGYKLEAKAGSTSPAEYDDNFTFRFSLDEGYTDSQYIVYVNGEKIQLNADLEFEIQSIREDMEVTVEGVELNTYDIYLPENQTGYSIGPATGSSSPVIYNKEYTFTLSLSTAYNKSTPVVKVNGTKVVLNDGQYTIKNIKEDKYITVEDITLNTYQVVIPDSADQIGYTLKFKAGTTGTVDYGASCGFTFELDEAYSRSSYTVRVNGTPVGIANNEYTIQNIRADQVITVENVNMNQYTISIPNYQTGYKLQAYTGSASPVYHGGNFTLQFVLLEGYDQSLSTFKLKLDGAEIQTALTQDGLYTISNITNDHVLTVEGIKINTYSIIYRYYTGATELTKQLEVNHGADVPLGDIPAADGRTGYNFMGWSSESTNITESKTITANYVIKTYVITWSAENADYGSDTWEYATHYQTSSQRKATSVVTYNSLYGYFEGQLDDALIKPSRLGYEFKGWYTQNVGGTQITRNTGVADLPSNTTYYAQWIATAIIVELDKNGGEGNAPVINSVYNQGDIIAIDQGGMSRPRYSFAGWSLDRLATKGEEEYKVNIADARLEEEVYTITLYAIWTRDTVTITFDANGGANPPEPTKVYTYESLTLTDAYIATRTGLTFYGWCASPNGTGTIYSKDFGVELIPVENTNVYLYAIWAYEITYNKNFPGQDEVTKKYSIINKDYQLETIYSVNYYTFVGWSLTPDGEVEYEDKFIFEPLESDLNLYGVWIAGYGTQSVPFKIGTIKDWNNVVGFYAPDDTIYYEQSAHIEETAEGQLLRIEEFAGNYNGNNKQIKLKNGCAPFDKLTETSKVTNLEVVATNFYFSTYAYFGGICLKLYGTLENCSFTTDTELTVTSTLYCGGLAAMSYSGSKIISCENTANIKVNGKNETYLGGLVGYADSGVEISASTNSGDMTTTSTSGTAHHVYIGGLIGYVNTTAVVTITNTINSGSFNSTNCVSDIAGLVGYLYNTAVITISNSHNSGDIATTANTAHNVGGIVGGAGTGVKATIDDCFNESTLSAVSGGGSYNTRVAGIIAFLDNTSELTITDCFNKGVIEGSGAQYTYLGGILGENEGKTTISYCYNLATIQRTPGKTGSYGFVGGLFSRIYNNSLIEFSYNEGNVTSTWSSGSNYIGGIGGHVGSSTNIENCYNTGIVDGTITYTGATEVVMYTGGLVGTYGTGEILNSYNSGYVKGVGTTGVRVGGLIGSLTNVKLTNTFNFANTFAEITRASEDANSAKSYTLGIGGVVGHSSTKLEMSYVYNAGAVNYKVANLTFQYIYAGGLVGSHGSNPTGTNIGWANDVSGDIRCATRSDTNSSVLSGTGMPQKTIMDMLKTSTSAIYSTWSTGWTKANGKLPASTIPNDADGELTVTLNSNYGTPTTKTVTAAKDRGFNIPSHQFTREGYTQIGWTTTSGEQIVQYNNNSSLTVSVGTTLYAVWAKGDGTSTYPYEISSVELWNKLLYPKALIAGTYFKQTADIATTMAHNAGLSQIWDFYGTYDGNSKKITLSSGSWGLFKSVRAGATVKNLNLVHNGSIGYYPYYSVLGGVSTYHIRKGGIAYDLMGSINNCTWTVGNVNSLTYSGTYYVGMVAYAQNGASITNSTTTYGSSVKPNTHSVYMGGIVGRVSGTVTISNCTAKGIIECSNIRESAQIGGIVGMNEGTLSISNSRSMVDITAPATNNIRIGGIIGCVGSGSATITGSYNSGFLIASSSVAVPCAGGIVGLASVSVSISNCYNTAYIDAACTSSSPNAGGLVGYSSSSLTILNSHNTGAVSTSATNGSSIAGGLIGYTVGYTMRDSFNIGRIMSTSNGAAYAAGVVGYQNITINTTMSNVYAGGTVSSNSTERRLGGVIGYKGGSATFTVSNTHWSSIIWSTVDSLGFSYSSSSQTGASQMSYVTMYNNLKNKTSEFYTSKATNAWDFTNTWKVDATYNSGLPYLINTDEANTFDVSVSLIDNARGNATITHKIGYGSSYIVSDFTFSASGYTFAGWATSNGGSPSYLDCYVVNAITSNLNLYSVWYNGDGTSSHPYEINNYTTWRRFVVQYASTENVYYKQVANITDDGNGSTLTTNLPSISEFRGVYDGNGYNFTISESANPFNVVYGTIKNLNVYSTSKLSSAGSSNYIAGLVTTLANTGKIDNCTMNGSITATYAGTNIVYVGGLVARVVGTGASITNSRNYAEITVNGNSSKIVGGILGGFDTAAASGVTIGNCINFANISVTTSSYYIFAGGLVGGSEQTNNTAKTATFTNCYNIGTINTTSTGIQGVGGLIGRLNDQRRNAAVSVSNSYNAAFVNTSTTKTTHLGGLIGYSDKVTVANSFNVGKLYGYVDSSVAINIGGLVGFAYNNKEANKITITKSYNAGLVNYSTNAMQDAAGGLVGGLQNATQYYDIGTTNFFVNNVGNARTKAVGEDGANITTSSANFATLIGKLRNFSSDAIYSGAWSTSTWKTQTAYNNGLPYFAGHANSMFTITISFANNYTTGSMSSSYLYSNSMFITPECTGFTPTDPDTTFLGWTTVEEGFDMEYSATALVKGLTENMTLYPVFGYE